MRFPAPILLALHETMLSRLLHRNYRLFLEPPIIHEKCDCDWVYGASMLVRKEVFERVGGFDPKIWMYGEEMELCYRMREAGSRVVFEPDASIVHYGEGSWRGDAARPILLRQLGLLFFYCKHYGTSWTYFARVMLLVGAAVRCFGWLVGAIVHLLHRAEHRRCLGRFRIYRSVLRDMIREMLRQTQP